MRKLIDFNLFLSVPKCLEKQSTVNESEESEDELYEGELIYI